MPRPIDQQNAIRVSGVPAIALEDTPDGGQQAVWALAYVWGSWDGARFTDGPYPSHDLVVRGPAGSLALALAAILRAIVAAEPDFDPATDFLI